MLPFERLERIEIGRKRAEATDVTVDDLIHIIQSDFLETEAPETGLVLWLLFDI